MQRWQTPSDTWQLCLELLLCSPQSPAQHRPGGRGAGGWPAFSSRPREGVWSSAGSAAATPSRAPQQEGTRKAACSLTPLEKPGSVAGLAGGNNPPHAPHHTAGTLSLWNDIQFLGCTGSELTG